jgi:hypothetical protein
VRYQLSELTKGVAFYSRLDLAFHKITDDRLRLVFTAVDPAHPAREFAFSVRVADSDAYVVDDVSPPLPRLAELVRELNAGNDFARFVQAMRREFKAGLEG